MKKVQLGKKFFWGVLFLLFFSSLPAQYYRVEYAFKFLPRPDLKVSKEDKAKMEKVKGLVDDYAEYLSAHKYILIFTPEESYYYVDAVEMPDDVANPVMYEISLH
ncbi:MAG: hypothetical protein GXO27_07160, partial [Chlorobi bacterium]|nr:hypothetical protein [Chlorobiota bacterium]